MSLNLPWRSQESELTLEGKIGIGQADPWGRALQPVSIPELVFLEDSVLQTSSERCWAQGHWRHTYSMSTLSKVINQAHKLLNYVPASYLDK